jgi:hypothetical protein
MSQVGSAKIKTLNIKNQYKTRRGDRCYFFVVIAPALSLGGQCRGDSGQWIESSIFLRYVEFVDCNMI